MSNKSSLPPYRVALRRFPDHSGPPSGMLLDRLTLSPSVAGSIYCSSQARRSASPNTLYRTLHAAQAFLSCWLEEGVDLEQRLLEGLPLSTAEIERYGVWLEERLQRDGGPLTGKRVPTFNTYLSAAERMTGWFMDMYFTADGVDRSLAIESRRRVAARAWRQVRKRTASVRVAPDLTDDEISTIETFLHNASRAPNAERRWVRAYLIWRLSIEFGFRIGLWIGVE